MIVKMFQPRFAPLVEAGVKLQTVRPTPKRMPKVGEPISLRAWTGKPYRSKQRVLRESVVTECHPITIHSGGIKIDGVPKYCSWVIDFAVRDGFKDFGEMLSWFICTHGLPFTGIVIKWSPDHLCQSVKSVV